MAKHKIVDWRQVKWNYIELRMTVLRKIANALWTRSDTLWHRRHEWYFNKK